MKNLRSCSAILILALASLLIALPQNLFALPSDPGSGDPIDDSGCSEKYATCKPLRCLNNDRNDHNPIDQYHGVLRDDQTCWGPCKYDWEPVLVPECDSGCDTESLSNCEGPEDQKKIWAFLGDYRRFPRDIAESKCKQLWATCEVCPNPKKISRRDAVRKCTPKTLTF